MKTKIFQLKSFANRGYLLTPVEFKDVVPFEVKRLYFMELAAGVSTSEHCHKIEEEVFILVKGTSTMIIDRGMGKEKIELTEPGAAIYVPAYVWHGFENVSSSGVVLALSSTNYNPDRSDYVDDYDEYLKIRDAKISL